MQEFMFFIRKTNGTSLPPDKQAQFLGCCRVYIEELRKAGRLIAAQPMEHRGMIVTDKGLVPLGETGDLIGGYYHLLANDLDEAIALARTNPEFEFNTGTRIEVRPVKTKEESTGFDYPGH